jgi:hypothetical protein
VKQASSHLQFLISWALAGFVAPKNNANPKSQIFITPSPDQFPGHDLIIIEYHGRNKVVIFDWTPIHKTI